MKSPSLSVVIAFGFFALGGSLVAQDATAHAPDGGTQQRVESVVILPIPSAPFTAVVTTEWTRIMPDGSTGTTKNHRMVARDSLGRVFQERRYFSPDGDKQTTQLSELDYQDPTLHQLMVCRPSTRVCTMYRYDMPMTVTLLKAGPLPNGSGTVTREELGRKTIDGVDVVGSREVTTLNAGFMGNEKPEPVVKEFWYSPRLGINVITKRFDPRASAVQNFVVGNINQAEPNARMLSRRRDTGLCRWMGSS
jgi:hypothetical protein